MLNYCNKASIPVIAKLPDDRRIAELYSRGKLIYPEIPEIELQLENILTQIMEKSNNQ